jgi:hypothetical protein
MKLHHVVMPLIVGYWIAAAAIVFGLAFWSPQTIIDRVEAADPTPISRRTVDFFEHTPRVEALLKVEETAGYPRLRRDDDRVRYGVGHLMLLLTMIADLLLVAVVTGIGAHRGAFEMDEFVAKPRPAARRIGTTGVTIFLALLVLGILVAMYAGLWVRSRHGSGPGDGSLAFVISAHLIVVVMIMTVIDAKRRRKEVSR